MFSSMGILHSVFQRHSAYIVPKTFPPVQRAPDLGILWPHTLLDELKIISDRLDTQRDIGKILPLQHLHRLKSLLQLDKLPLDEHLRQCQIARVKRCIDFHMAL